MSISNSSESKISGLKKSLEKGGASNYINKSNIINEKSSDNDFENSNMDDFHLNDPGSLYEREFRRFTLEYIKVIGLHKKEKKEEININEIVQEYQIPKEVVGDLIIEEENENSKKEEFEITEEESKEEKIEFDNDIQPMPKLNEEMEHVIYLSKPKIVGFDGKLGLFYISPPPIGKESEYSLIVKNPENLKIIYKIKLLEIIKCEKNDNCLSLQNFGNKILMKTNHEMTFKNEEDCKKVHKGINFLMKNKEDYIYY